MKKLFLFLLFATFSFETLSEPNVLKCEKNCGLLDINDDFTFQARMAQGEDMWGANVTFIENDIILSSAHILGFEPDRRKLFLVVLKQLQKKYRLVSS